MNSDRTEPEAAEHSGTSQRDLSKIQDEIDTMTKNIQDLTSEIDGLNNQLDLLRSSDSAPQHQGGEAASELASKSEEVQQLQGQLQTLREEHKEKLDSVKCDMTTANFDLRHAESTVHNLNKEKRIHMKKSAYHVRHIEAIFDEARRHDKDGTYPNTYFLSEDWVVDLVSSILLKFQTEVQSTTLDMEE